MIEQEYTKQYRTKQDQKRISRNTQDYTGLNRTIPYSSPAPYGGPYPMKGSTPPIKDCPPIKNFVRPPNWVIGSPHLTKFVGALHIQFFNSCYVFSKIRSDSQVLEINITHCCHTRLHLGFSAMLKIQQVSACKMEPQSGMIMYLGPTTQTPQPTHPHTRCLT